MEAVEATLLEGAILWLAQTILESLFSGKLDEWIRQIGIADDTEKLKSEVERVETLVAAVKGRAAENRPLARSLGRLRELLYDADDMVDELDYYRLQHQVQGGTGTIDWANQPQDNSGIPNRNERKKRSKAWEEFSIIEEDADGKPVKAECIHCRTQVRCETTNGTSVLHNHLKSDSCKRKRAAIEQTPNPSSAADGAPIGATIATYDSGSRKRMRTDEVSAHSPAANTDPWNKAKFGNRIKQMTLHLKKAINEVHKIHGSSSVASSNLCQNTAADPCRRTSSLVHRKMFGRDAEKNSIIKHMTGDEFNGLIVIPIVGIGGIGKTALAQIIYNDPVVKSQFDHRMWIWVSNDFDEVRLTTEMLDFVSQEKQGISSLAELQEIFVSHVTSKRCLLILDDVWDDMDDHAWNKFLAPMQPDNEKSNVILVTTRKLSIANVIGTVEPIKLGALENDDFWLLFKSCAFGNGNHEGHPSLNIIGQQIVKKLYGNPLAAVTVGMLLRVRRTVDHWSNILKNEKWKFLHLNKGIMYALKLSYDKLPYYLQQCFLCCSIFPKNYQFRSNELIYIWIAQGFVKCGLSTEILEEVGRDYITDLVNSCFFEQVETEEPTPSNQTCYVMPALVHDFARLVSRTECAALDGLDCNDVPPTIRHLSILTDSVYHEDQHGHIHRNIKFEEKLRTLATSVTKLRTLVLIGKYDSFFFQSFQDAFNKARYLRALQISAMYAEFDSFLCNSENSTHLRYLKREKKGSSEFWNINGSSESLHIPPSRFYHLQVLDVGHATAINDMSDLVSTRHLVVKKGAHFVDPNSICLEMTQLQSMNELVHLGVHRLQNVNGAEACGCKNLLFVSLKGFRQLISLKRLEIGNCVEFFSSDVVPEHAHEDMETANFNAFPTLKHLNISSYSPSPNKISGKWLSVMLRHAPVLEELHLYNCEEISGFLIEGKESCLSNHSSGPLASSPGNADDASTSSTREGVMHIPSNLLSSLKKLSISYCHALTFLDKKACFSAFTSLEDLRIWGCPKLISSFEPKDENSSHANGGCLLPYSSSEPGIVQLESLQNPQLCPRKSVNCLKRLDISGNKDLESLKLDSYTKLEELVIWNFDSLTAVEGLQSLRGLRHLNVYGCPCLPPFLEPLSVQVSELFPRLDRLWIHDYSFLTTSFRKHLSSLQRLQLCTGFNKATGLTGEQDRVLQLIQSLQDLEFASCYELVDLPVCLHSLSSLKWLKIINCRRILRLPEKGLTPSLEKLEISGCSEELTGQCRALATSMLKVQTSWKDVN